MATISEKIDKILDEKIQKIRPENIANGIQIFEVIGNANILNGEEKVVDPSASKQEILPSGEHNGLTKVTVNAVTNAIDENIQASNIKKGIEILGVTGTVEELKGQTKTVTPTTGEQTITPDEIYNGLTSVTVNAVTPAIDSNIQASNIKKGISILGIAGELVEVPIFATIDELNSHTNYPENTFAIVYGTSYVGTYKLDKNVWTQVGDSTEEVQVMNTFNKIDNTQDEYEGLGGTDEEINTVLNNVIGGSQI